MIQNLRSDGDAKVSGKDVEDFLKAYDVNHDNKLSFEEFADGITRALL